MVLERAEISVAEGKMDEFLDLFVSEALPLTRQFTGLISFTALRGVEDENSVMFLAEWVSIEAHLASRPEPAHERFRQVVKPYVVGAKQTVHFLPVGQSAPST